MPEEAGHDAVHVSEVGLLSAPDPEIMEAAARADRILLTADADFGALLALRCRAKPSVVLLRSADHLRPAEQAELLIANLSPISDDLERGAIASLTRDRLSAARQKRRHGAPTRCAPQVAMTFGQRPAMLGRWRARLPSSSTEWGRGRFGRMGARRISRTPIRSYERALRVHIAPSLVGQLKVTDVQRRDLQQLADELLASGLAVGTVSNIFNPIQAFYRRAVHRGDLPVKPAEGIDLPNGGSQRPARIASAAEAAALLAALAPADRPVWATAFYAGLRRGELQALRCCDLDFEASLIRVERGWDQEEGVIDPKSRSGRRAVPMLAILRRYLQTDLKRTGRTGTDLVFGRTPDTAFVSSTVDNRAKKAWSAFNDREREEPQRPSANRSRFFRSPCTSAATPSPRC